MRARIADVIRIGALGCVADGAGLRPNGLAGALPEKISVPKQA